MGPTNPLSYIEITVEQFAPSCFPQRRDHRIPQLDYNHLQISLLHSPCCTRVVETGSSRVNSFSLLLGLSSSSKLSSWSMLFFRELFMVLAFCPDIIQSAAYIQLININIMITIRHLLVAIAVLAPLTTALRESDLGKNDWSIENIGKIREISFPQFNHDEQSKHNRQVKSLFFCSELGLFGLLDRRTGEIQARESLFDGEQILGSDDKQITISTHNGQIVIYNKYTMRRTVDNRAMSKDFKNVNSYVKSNSKVYVANDAFIKEFELSIKKHEELASIQAPAGYTIQKVFYLSSETDALYAILYNDNSNEVCLDIVDTAQATMSHKKCIKITLGQGKYVRFFQNKNVFFGDKSQHYHLSLATLEEKKFNSKPVYWSQNEIKFQNGLVFTSKGSPDDKLLPVQSNTKDKVFQAQLSSTHLIIYETTSGSKGDRLTSLNVEQKQFKVSKIWLHFLSQTDYEIIVEFQDLELVMYTSQGREFKQLWSRDESLAYVEKVLFMKYEGYADNLNTPYHMKMDDPQYIALSLMQKIQQIPGHFISRVKSELQDIYNFLIQKFEAAVKTFTHPKELQEFLNVGSYIKSTMSSESEKKYGLQKYIIVITAYDTMFSIDTKTSNIIWKKKYGKDLKLVGLIKLKQEYEKEIAIAISYNYHITYITQIHEDGTLTELQEFQTFGEPTVHKLSAHSILLRANQKIHRFDINKNLFGAEKEYGFYSVEEDNKRVVGWKIVNQNLMQTWSMEIPSSEKIISTAAAYRGQPEANLPLTNDKKVLFKNVDFSNLAVLTLETVHQQVAEGSTNKPTTHRLKLYIVNGLTGTIQFNEFQTGINPNLPIRLVYDEHNAIVTYYSLRNRVFEIWTVQAFQMPDQGELLSKPYAPVHQRGDITFKSKVYGTVLPIKNVFISQSKQALLRRNLIIITRENKIYSLPREMVSTRRPKSADADANANSGDAEFISSKYPMEQYILPVNTLGFLNYNKKLSQLSFVRFSSSDLQSTIFMMAYGIDLFLVRVAPDKAFDMLADGFNYLQLIAIMIAVTFAAIFFRGKAKEAKLRKLHLD